MATMREERQRYFEENGFGEDGGYNENWIKVKIGPIALAIPNSAPRKKAVPFHDLHHILTGYRTDWIGEAEIAAWELASGCKHMIAAWVLNLFVLGMKVLFSPGRVYRAFMRGRQSRNLYNQGLETLLDQPAEEVRERMGTTGNPAQPSGKDRLAFVVFSIVALAMFYGPPSALVWLTWLWLG
jgi:hypothetical protein